MPSYRQREMSLFLMPDDVAALEAALVATFGRIACYGEEIGSREGRGFRRPTGFLASLAGLRHGEYCVVVPDDGWEPRLKPGGWLDGLPALANPPPRRLHLYLSDEPYRRDPEDGRGEAKYELMDSHVVTAVAKGNAKESAFANTLMKILRELSTPHLVRIDYWTLEATDKPLLGYRAGHHAVAWCLAHERRIFGSLTGTFRPHPDPPAARQRRAAAPAKTKPATQGRGKRLWVPRTGLMTMGLFFTREDSDAFGRALEAAFPRVLFVSRDFEDAATIHESLGALSDDPCTIYLSEDGEAAEPGPAGGAGDARITWLADPPPLSLTYCAKHDARNDWAAPYPSDDGWLITAGQVGVQYRRGDAEGLAFARRIMRILAGVSSPAMVRVDPKSGRILEPGKRVTGFRAGGHALAWCRATPERLMVAKDGEEVVRFRPRR